MWTRTATAVLLVCALALMLTGCAERIAEEALEQSTGAQVDIEDEGGSVTIETDEGSIDIAGGESAAIPDEFPDEMPVYDGELITSSMLDTGDGSVYSVGLETDDAVDEVASWYETELEASGWAIVSDMRNDMADSQTASFLVEQGSYQGQVIITTDGDGMTQIALTVTEEA